MSIFAELKLRNVFRVAIADALATLIQAANKERRGGQVTPHQ